MLGLKQTRPLGSWELGRNPRFGAIRLEPVEILDLKVMSVGFLIAEAQALTMPAMLVESLARQLLDDVDWGSLDYLVVDLPPGTADLQQQIFATFGVVGAIVVVGPQDAAHLDARKLLTMLRNANVPVLGVVENMTALECPHCGEHVHVFPPVADERSILRELPLLGSIPLDPSLSVLNGVPPAFAEIAARVADALA
jgi:ATP-binding protein involved in chromosome partitioning